MLNYIVSYESCSCWHSMQSGCIVYGIDLNSIGVNYMCPCQHLNDIYIFFFSFGFLFLLLFKRTPKESSIITSRCYVIDIDVDIDVLLILDFVISVR